MGRARGGRQRARGLQLIDDSCEALGASLPGRAPGSFRRGCRLRLLPEQADDHWRRRSARDRRRRDRCLCARSLRNQGRGEMGAWVEHERLGYNYRMDEMSAALGLSQLARLDEILEKREKVAEMYTEKARRARLALHASGTGACPHELVRVRRHTCRGARPGPGDDCARGRRGFPCAGTFVHCIECLIFVRGWATTSRSCR